MTIAEQELDRSPYVTTTKGMRGWFAVYVWWNPEGFWEPWATGEGSYATQEEAREDAKNWAINDEVRYVE